MADWTRTAFLGLNDVGYAALRRVLFHRPAQGWHESLEGLLSSWDDSRLMQTLCRQSGR